MGKKILYNHACTVAFTVVTPHKADEVTADEFWRGLLERVRMMEEYPQERCEDAFEIYNTYKEGDGI